MAVKLFPEEEMEVRLGQGAEGRRCYLLHNNPLHSSSFRGDVSEEEEDGRAESEVMFALAKRPTSIWNNLLQVLSLSLAIWACNMG